jgi:hypothetical protein
VLIDGENLSVGILSMLIVEVLKKSVLIFFFLVKTFLNIEKKKIK